MDDSAWSDAIIMDMLKNQHRESMRFFIQEFVDACRQRRRVERKFLPLAYHESKPFMPQNIAPVDTPSPRTDGIPKTVL